MSFGRSMCPPSRLMLELSNPLPTSPFHPFHERRRNLVAHDHGAQHAIVAKQRGCSGAGRAPGSLCETAQSDSVGSATLSLWRKRKAMSGNNGTNQSDRTRKLRHLHELIAALDRRVPHVERNGEIAIARDGRALKEKALRRIAELEANLQTSPTG